MIVARSVLGVFASRPVRLGVVAAVLLMESSMAALPFEDFAADDVETNGVTLHVRKGGEGPAVVLMHGWSGSSHGWRDVAPLLVDAGYTVIVPDMRGYGRSDKPTSMPGPDGAPRGGYDARNEARDVAGLLDHYGIEAAHVVGHDMGAPVALMFAGDLPERTLSLGYVDEPLIGYNHTEMTAFSEKNHGGFWQFGLNWTPGLPEILYEDHEEAFLRFIFDAMTVSDGVMTDEDVAAHAYGMKQEGGIDGWVGWYRAVPQTAAQVREVVEGGLLRDTPTLAVAGEGGIIVVPDQMERVSDRVTGHVIEGSGHLVPEEKPGELADAMIAFFRSTEGDRP